MENEDIKNMVEVNIALFGEEIGFAMSIYQAIIISSLNQTKVR